MAAEAPDDLPRLILRENNDTLTQLLLNGKRLLVQHPQVARAIVQGFVAEGRRFAETSDGQAWKAVLSQSELVRRGRLIWEAYGLDAMLETESGFVVPSAWLDLIVEAVANSDLETVLSTLMVEEVGYGTIGSL